MRCNFIVDAFYLCANTKIVKVESITKKDYFAIIFFIASISGGEPVKILKAGIA